MTTWTEIGPCRLACGDCLDILPELPAASIDAVVTDPPYQMRSGGSRVPIRGKGVAERKVESTSIGEPWGFSLDWIVPMQATNPKHVCVFSNSHMLGELIHGLTGQLEVGAVFVWQKPNAAPNCRNTPKWDCEFVVWMKNPKASSVRASEFRSQVIRVPFPQAGCFASERILEPGSKRAAHPTQKPVAVVAPFVDCLTERGWQVLDPFMGTGTTGVACLARGRRFIGIVKSQQYFDIACRRIEAAVMAAKVA